MASKTAKQSGARELVNTGTDARYARRDTTGRWTEMDDVGRSQKADKARKASTVVPPGYGDRGDQAQVARRAAKKR